MRVLVTRPAEDAARTAARLEAAGHKAVIAPLFAIKPTGAAIDPAGVGGILLTSRNGVRTLSGEDVARFARLPVFAVGDATAQAARDAGFQNVTSASSDSAALVRVVRRAISPHTGALVHIAGAHVAGDVAGDLKRVGFAVRRIVAYDAVAEDALAVAARDTIIRQAPEMALVYSERAAEALIGLYARMPAWLARPGIAAISARAARPFAEAGGWKVKIASRLDEAALLAALET
ncbi:MAG: uroporphyrinogen-III synthase [Rhodobiaceae bacterium]|nr:uroporphyrinogen-III synthase [Rhodobiaceae bacterium]MCC0055498.1 uroporphyrinogen-III synthase [Rhodobiaceae bacterium]